MNKAKQKKVIVLIDNTEAPAVREFLATEEALVGADVSALSILSVTDVDFENVDSVVAFGKACDDLARVADFVDVDSVTKFNVPEKIDVDSVTKFNVPEKIDDDDAEKETGTDAEKETGTDAEKETEQNEAPDAIAEEPPKRGRGRGK